MYADAYNSGELTLFTNVLEHVCDQLGALDDGYRASIGRRIIFKAETGERRFEALAHFASQGALFAPSKPAHRNRDEIILPYRFSMIDPASDRGRFEA